MKYRDENGDFQDLYFKTGDTLPIGTIVSYGSLTPPTNWLVCDGSAVSRTAYAALFAVIGTSYGSGDGSTTFNLPDLRGRVPVGKSTDTEFDTLGETGGEKKHTLTTQEMPSHTHKFGYITGDQILYSNPYVEGEVMGHQPTNIYTDTSSAGGGQAHNNLQPYQVVCFIIKAEDSAGVVGNVTNTQNNSTKDTYSCDYINDLVEEVYSTSETLTNKVWIDGTPVYRKTIAYTGTALSSGANSIQHNISNIGTHREIVASEFWYNNNMWNGFVTPTSYCTANAVNNTTVDVSISDDFGGLFSPVYITLEYTKTTD